MGRPGGAANEGGSGTGGGIANGRDLMTGPGAVRALLRDRDWRPSPLGPPDEWPSMLLAAVRICLEAHTPALAAWGPSCVLVYNDAALPLLGDRHADAFGLPARESRAELWDVMEPAVAAVRADGQPRRSDYQLLALGRNGTSEERYFDFLYSPVLENGAVAGVLCTAEDTTVRVLAKRRSAALAELIEGVVLAENEEQGWLAARAALERNPADLPFLLLYRTETRDEIARLAGTVGVADSARAPAAIDPSAPGAPWPLDRAWQSQSPELGAGALVLPVIMPEGGICGFLVAGLNPRQPLDEPYRDFLKSAAERVAIGIQSIRARARAAQWEEALERARARLEQRCIDLNRLFEHAPIPIAVVRGPEFVVESANASAQAVIPGRQVVGMPLFEALPELADQDLEGRMQDVAISGRPDIGFEAPVRLERDGSIEQRYFTFISTPLSEPNGETRIIIVANDVTEQVRVRSALEASEARYRDIFESVDVSIWEEDFSAVVPMLEELAEEGGGEPQAYFDLHPEFLQRALRRVSVVDVNAATIRMFGAADKHELEHALPRIFVPETWHAFGEKLVAVAERRDLVRTETVALTLGGERRNLLMTIARSNRGAANTALITLMDITERTRMEEALREADRHKDEFLATLAHELRNPLAPLRSCVDLLRTPGAEADVGSLIDIIERQVDHIARLADDLFQSSRIQHGTYELREERVLVADVLRDALDTSGPLIRNAGHRLEVEVPDEPMWLDGDPTRLAQIFANLLNNAARYTRSPGSIKVRARPVDAQVEVSVEDTGIGIPAGALPRLFTMFSRVGDGEEAGAGGLGIGLALAKQLVEMHRGTIEAHSAGPGQGSEFKVRLPLAEIEREGDGGVEQAAQPIADRRILIVEDNPDAAESLRRVLEVNGAQVRTAGSGLKGLSLFASFKPDVALLDISVPDMSGYELARRIRTEYAEHSAVLIALTGWGREEDLRRAREAGFDYHLVKPVDFSALRNLLGKP